MGIQFFSFNNDYKDPVKNAEAKIKFGFFCIIVAIASLIMASIESAGSTDSSPVTATGILLKAFIELLQLIIGKWIATSIFALTGIFFIFKGLKEKDKHDLF